MKYSEKEFWEIRNFCEKMEFIKNGKTADLQKLEQFLKDLPSFKTKVKTFIKFMKTNKFQPDLPVIEKYGNGFRNAIVKYRNIEFENGYCKFSDRIIVVVPSGGESTVYNPKDLRPYKG